MGIEKFDKSNFSLQKMKIKDYLYRKYLYKPLFKMKNETMTTQHWKLKDYRIDSVDAVHKRDLQHYQGEYDIGSVEDIVKHVKKRKT